LHIVPPSKGSYGAKFAKFEGDFHEFMPTIFERYEAPEFSHEVHSQEETKIENDLFQKAKMEFAACMNASHVENPRKISSLLFT
jgi:hypothetical protein